MNVVTLVNLVTFLVIYWCIGSIIFKLSKMDDMYHAFIVIIWPLTVLMFIYYWTKALFRAVKDSKKK